MYKIIATETCKCGKHQPGVKSTLSRRFTCRECDSVGYNLALLDQSVQKPAAQGEETVEIPASKLVELIMLSEQQPST